VLYQYPWGECFCQMRRNRYGESSTIPVLLSIPAYTSGVSNAPAPGSTRPSVGPLELLWNWITDLPMSLWRWLNSLPIAIFVMLALTLLSALGTMVPQEHLNPQPPGLTFQEFMAQRYGADKFHIMHVLGFDHVYFTWYFNTLLTWLAVSAVICNIVRWRTTWRLWTAPVVRRGERFFLADKRSALFSTSGAAAGSREVERAPALASASQDEVAESIADDLKQLGYRIRTEGDGEARTLYADKGFSKKWALVGLHVAILILLFGGFYGRAVGLNGDVRLKDGEQETLTLDITKGKYAWIQPVLEKFPKLSYQLHQHKFRIDWGRKLVLETDLQKNVPGDLKEYYWYYVNDYVSDLETSFTNRRGRTHTVRGEVKVNHPQVVNKLVIYQSGYDQRGYLLISSGGHEREERIPDPLFGKDTWYGLMADHIVMWHPQQQRWFIPVDHGDQVGMQFVETSAVADIVFKVEQNVKSGDLYKHHKKVGHIGPMAIFTLRARDDIAEANAGSLLVTGDNGFDTRLDTHNLNVRLSPKVEDYSVFAYKRDPGSPVLFTGWILLVAGIALTMYVPFTQVWLRAEPGRLSVLVLGPERKRLKKRLDVMLGIEP
jgi:cytochrome c biogenesis protein ResB